MIFTASSRPRISDRLTPAFLVLLLLPTWALAGDSPSTSVNAIAPGDRLVQGARLQPFEATWTQRLAGEDGWTERGGVREELTIAQEGGREVLVRKQTSLGQLTFVNTSTFDRKTLAPIRFERELAMEVPAAVQEKLDQQGVLSKYRIEFDGAIYSKFVPSRDGGEEETQGRLAASAYDGSVLGLVVAALPLSPSYSARLPVAFISPMDGAITEYLVDATVQGQESASIGGGKTTKAWLVDIAWLDAQSGEVSSAGGADEAGGAYWVLTDPKKGLPHVPKYRNESVDFELQPVARLRSPKGGTRLEVELDVAPGSIKHRAPNR